ncbi:hypothetical protein MPER_10102 [Moniliophthora perniciosa FA553]|nr:hypothetical protein MPER_10102 [Moniliophthora perniciosa FA553]
MSFNNYIVLNNGVKMPQIGLGTWQSTKPGEAECAVESALKEGYRHIDAAVIYGNQKEVGAGIKKSSVPRSEIFLVSKLWNNSHRPELVEADLDNTLKELDTDYLDLYLIHWPVPFQPGTTLSATRSRVDDSGEREVVIDTEAPSIAETWKTMVALLKSGKVRAIGVSNFTIEHLEILARASDVIPAVNQIEAHPLLQQDDLTAYSKEKGIHPLGQNIIGRPPVIAHSTVAAVASDLGVTPSQILIAWGVAQGYSVIPKSVTPERIKSNFSQITLPQDALKKITDLPRGQGRMRYNIPFVYDPRWDINVFNEPEEQNASRTVW